MGITEASGGNILRILEVSFARNSLNSIRSHSAYDPQALGFKPRPNMKMLSLKN